MFSFQNAWPIKIKAVYTLVLFHIIHSFPWLALITTCVFFKTTYFILVNLQLVARGKKLIDSKCRGSKKGLKKGVPESLLVRLENEANPVYQVKTQDGENTYQLEQGDIPRVQSNICGPLTNPTKHPELKGTIMHLACSLLANSDRDAILQNAPTQYDFTARYKERQQLFEQIQCGGTQTAGKGGIFETFANRDTSNMATETDDPDPTQSPTTLAVGQNWRIKEFIRRSQTMSLRDSAREYFRQFLHQETLDFSNPKQKCNQKADVFCVVDDQEFTEKTGIVILMLTSLRSLTLDCLQTQLNGELGHFVVVSKQPTDGGGRFHAIVKSCKMGIEQKQQQYVDLLYACNDRSVVDDLKKVVSKVLKHAVGEEFLFYRELICLSCGRDETHKYDISQSGRKFCMHDDCEQ